MSQLSNLHSFSDFTFTIPKGKYIILIVEIKCIYTSTNQLYFTEMVVWNHIR